MPSEVGAFFYKSVSNHREGNTPSILDAARPMELGAEVMLGDERVELQPTDNMFEAVKELCLKRSWSKAERCVRGALQQLSSQPRPKTPRLASRDSRAWHALRDGIHGVVLTGGCALNVKTNEAIRQRFGLAVHVPAAPVLCTFFYIDRTRPP